MREITLKGGILCAGILAAAFYAPAVWAQTPDAKVADSQVKPEDREAKIKKHFAEMAETLKLTKEQQAQLDKNREQRKAEFESSREKISAKRQELREALDGTQLDIKKVTAIHNELKELMIKREDQHLAAILEIRQVLTPEQFAQFQKMGAERKGPPHGEGHDTGEKKE
ncbi:MAG: Spy/CpxP family protein refolding chaperone [Candidatus Omnitrophica bacterium]|nr:Spy/CpxP family protein refolding chaperone [Candidatus Omnitrophota bacterium]